MTVYIICLLLSIVAIVKVYTEENYIVSYIFIAVAMAPMLNGITAGYALGVIFVHILERIYNVKY